jgi:hypothetical protein
VLFGDLTTEVYTRCKVRTEERIIDRAHLKITGNCIWSLKVPSKVRYFLWCLVRNCLPNRIQLQHKGVHCSPRCVSCDDEMENNWHVFLECPCSVACWRRIGIYDFLQNSFSKYVKILMATN